MRRAVVTKRMSRVGVVGDELVSCLGYSHSLTDGTFEPKKKTKKRWAMKGCIINYTGPMDYVLFFSLSSSSSSSSSPSPLLHSPPSPHFLLVTSRACSSNTCFGLLGSPLLVLSLLFSAPSAGPPPWPATLFAAAPACASDWCAGSGDWRPGFGADISFFVPLGSGWRRGGGLACGVLYCRCVMESRSDGLLACLVRAGVVVGLWCRC